MVPDDGVYIPIMAFTKVLLPVAFCPRIAWASPFSNVKSTPCRTILPEKERYRFDTCNAGAVCKMFTSVCQRTLDRCEELLVVFKQICFIFRRDILVGNQFIDLFNAAKLKHGDFIELGIIRHNITFT